MVCVDVSGRDRLDTEMLREVAKCGVSACIPALVRPLELDEEAIAAERPSEPRGAARITNAKADPRAAGEADEPLGELQRPCPRIPMVGGAGHARPLLGTVVFPHVRQ